MLTLVGGPRLCVFVGVAFVDVDDGICDINIMWCVHIRIYYMYVPCTCTCISLSTPQITSRNLCTKY